MKTKTSPLTAIVDGNQFIIDLGLMVHVKSWSPKKIKQKVNWSDSWFQEIVGMYKRLTGTTYCMVGTGIISEDHLTSISIIKEISLVYDGFIVKTSKADALPAKWIILFKYDGKRNTYVPWRTSFFSKTHSVSCIRDVGYNDGQ